MDKKILCFFVIFVLLIITTTEAQVAKATFQLKRNNIEKAKETIDLALNNNSEIASPKAWLVKSEVYKSIYLSRYKKIKLLDTMPLYNSANALIKAFHLAKKENKKGKETKLYTEIKDGLPFMSYHLQRAIGLYNFKHKKYEIAILGFEKALEIDTLLDKLDYSDTLYYYTGLTSYEIGEYRKAINYYNAAAYIGYGDKEIYVKRAESYLAMGDTAAAEKMMKKGIKRYARKNQALVDYLLNIYLAKNDTTSALKFLDKALKINPKNEVYFFAKGKTYAFIRQEIDFRIFKREEKMENLQGQLSELAIKASHSRKKAEKRQLREIINQKRAELEKLKDQIEKERLSIDVIQKKTIDSYKKAINLKEKYYEANLELGMLFFNMGHEQLAAANLIPLKNRAKFRDMQLIAADHFRDAKPYLERANKLKPSQIELMEDLYLIYKNCNMPEKERIIQDDIWELKRKLKREEETN